MRSTASAAPSIPIAVGAPGVSLPSGEVHVWWISLDSVHAFRDAPDAVLSADERERADRFRRPQLSRRFKNGRAALREVLARYAGLPAAGLRFVYGPQGKPALAGDSEVSGLRFNLSHAEDVAVIAVARDREVGVDVERIREDLPLASLSERFFAPAEASFLRGVDPAARASAFFGCWTRKEAFVKALGGGLSVPLDSFAVSLGEEPTWVIREGAAPEAVRWCVRGLPSPFPYAAAIAHSGDARLRIGRARVGADGGGVECLEPL